MRTGRARRSCRAKPARTGRLIWRRTTRRWRSETRPTRPRRAACIAFQARGRPGPDRCRRLGTPAGQAARCREWRRCSARRSRPWHHVAEINDQADEADERKFDQPHRAGEHDRRIGALVGLRRGRRRQRRRIGARQCRHCRRYRRGCLKDLAGSRLGDDRHVFAACVCSSCLVNCRAGRAVVPAGRRAGKIVNKIQKLVM